jgi:hypothetical protein
MQAPDFECDDNEPTSRIERRVLDRVLEEERPTRREMPVAISFFSRVPRLAVPLADLAVLPLDHREGFLLSLIDGTSTVEAILDVCAMSFDEAVETLAVLVERRIVRMD